MQLHSLCLNFFHQLARKPNLEEKKLFIQNKFSFVKIELYSSRASDKWVSAKTGYVSFKQKRIISCDRTIIFRSSS